MQFERVRAFKKAGGPRVLTQLVDAPRLLADAAPRHIIELGVALGCVRALVRGVDELGAAFVREGLPARIVQVCFFINLFLCLSMFVYLFSIVIFS